MFDDTPSNLPVEPPAQPIGTTPGPQPVPQASPSLPRPVTLHTPPVPPPPLPPRPPRPPSPPPSPQAASSAPQPSQPQPPQAASHAPFSQPIVAANKKTPEDIFSGIEEGLRTSTLAEPVLIEELPRKSPLKILLLLAGVVIVIIGVGYGLWTFVLAPRAAQKLTASLQQPADQQPVSERIETPPVIEESPAVVPITQPPAGSNIPTPQAALFPLSVVTTTPSGASVVALEGNDTDGDALTDAEESVYNTNPINPDTDGDGYLDGSEVLNLFSPLAKSAPLAASPTIKKDGWNGWSFLLPKTWSVLPDGQNSGKASMTMPGYATSIMLELKTNSNRSSLAGWVALHGGDPASLRALKTKGGLDALQTSDGLTTYVAVGDGVLLVAYTMNRDASYEFRTSYAMFLNSLQYASAKK